MQCVHLVLTEQNALAIYSIMKAWKKWILNISIYIIESTKRKLAERPKVILSRTHFRNISRFDFRNAEENYDEKMRQTDKYKMQSYGKKLTFENTSGRNFPFPFPFQCLFYNFSLFLCLNHIPIHALPFVLWFYPLTHTRYACSFVLHMLLPFLTHPQSPIASLWMARLKEHTHTHE